MYVRARYPLVVLFLAALLFACGGGGGGGDDPGGGNNPPPGGTGNPSDCFSGTGSTNCSCPASTGISDPVAPAHYDYVLSELNAIRTARGLTTFSRTTALDTFAQAASVQLMGDNVPHGYFSAQIAANGGSCPPAFSGFCAENQGSPFGWFANVTTTQIDEMIACFMSEETAPANCVRGHFEAIVCPELVRVGIGLVKDGAGNLFLTIDFSL